MSEDLIRSIGAGSASILLVVAVTGCDVGAFKAIQDQNLGTSGGPAINKQCVGKTPAVSKAQKTSAKILTTVEFKNVLEDLLEIELSASTLASFSPTPKSHGFDRVGATLADSKTVKDRYAAVYEAIEKVISDETLFNCSADSYSGHALSPCLKNALIDLTERAWRRRTTSSEQQTLVGLFNSTKQHAMTRFGEPRGHFDVVTSSLVAKGWSLDPDWELRKVVLKVYIDGNPSAATYVGDAVAGTRRPDVNSVTGFKGDHGFEFAIPRRFADGRTHTITVVAQGNPNKQLNMKTFTAGSNAQNAAVPVFWSTEIAEGIKAALLYTFLSPQFHFREVFDNTNGSPKILSSYQIAERLSFFFGATAPDSQLWQKAKSGRLATDKTLLRAEAHRLLDKYQERFVDRFFGQWLNFDDLARRSDLSSLQRSMLSEVKLQMAEHLRLNSKLETLLNPGFTFLNQQLANNYQIPLAISSGLFQKVTTLDRGGLLQLAAFHHLTASGDLTSPIRRGKWVLDNIMCITIPPPNEDIRQEIEEVSQSIDPNLPIDEKLEIHRNANTSCYSCHEKMDPIGLGLEPFDHLGRLRTNYPDGHTVKQAGRLLGQPFEGPAALSKILAETNDYKNCFTNKVIRYALSLGIKKLDSCSTRMVMTEETGLRDLIINIILQDAFQTYKSEGV